MALPLIPIIMGVGKAIGVLAKGVNKATKSKKASEFVKGEEKKGGAMVVRKKTGIDKAEKIMGGKSSALAIIDKPKIKLGFRDINTQIDNVIVQTVSIRKIVATRYALDKSSFEKNRRLQENLRRKKREAELENKKRKGKGRKLGLSIPGESAIGRYLTNILLGAGILALLDNLDKIENAYDFALKNSHKIWVGMKYGLQFLKNQVGKLLKFLKTSAGNLLKKINTKIGRFIKKGKIKILKAFRNLSKAITGFGLRLWNRIVRTGVKAGETASDLIRGGDKARRLRELKRLKESRNAARAARKLKIAQQLKRQSFLVRGMSPVQIKGTTVLAPSKAPSIPSKSKAPSTPSTKLFGSKVSKQIASSKPLFKTLSKAAKGIKIPIVGPIIVLITSLLAGDNVNKSLFKGFGTLFGGLLGSPLGPLGMLVGELLGEVFGEVLYEGFMGTDGWAGAGRVLKEKWDGLVKGGEAVMKWIAGGLGRVGKNIMKSDSLTTNVPQALRWAVGGLEKIPHPAIFLNPVGLLLKSKELGGILVKSFFPPAEDDKEKTSLANITSSSKKTSKGIEKSASYDSEEDVVIPFNLDSGEEEETAVLPVVTPMLLNGASGSSVNSYYKSHLMAQLA